ncbi:MAG: hypothetical protein J6X55_16755 [Victivallales bacterium]|nr:hypothetical protein [Victivallales bacterium]
MADEMIVEAIRSVKMNEPDATMAAPAGAVAPVANPDSVARFQAAMAATPVEKIGRIDDIPFAAQVSATWRSAQADNQEMLHRIRALSEMSAKGGTYSGALLELQYEVASLSFQQEVVAKVADKSSNAVQTLIKNQ